ncbi:MAG: transmembrane ion channel [Flavobacterium sp.]|nr:MAG: transmembrane ion channel [Flavobacterium sp.]
MKVVLFFNNLAEQFYSMVFKKMFFVLLLFSSMVFSQTSPSKTEIDSVKLKAQKITRTESPVILNSDTLFFLNNTISNYPAEIRALNISEKLQKLKDKYNPIVDSLYSENKASYFETKLNNEILFITTQNDADVINIPLNVLAEYRLKMTLKSFNNKPDLSLKQGAISIGFFILTLFGLIVIVKLINFLFKKLTISLSKIERKFLRKNGYIIKYFIPKKTANIFVFVANIIRITLLVILFIVYSPFMFSFFPWAENIVVLFYDYISTPVKFIFYGFVDFIPSLFFIIIIAYFARYIVRVGKEIALDIDKGKLEFDNFHKDWAMPTEKIFSVIIYAMALILIFPYIPGSGSSAFQGVSIFIGAIISFGSTSAISNIIAGIVITYMRPFQIGDRVKINDIVGDVTDKTILVTHLKTTKNENVTIPNANILLGTITNYSNTEDKSIILHTTVTLGYDLPWETAEKLLLAAASNTQLIEKEPAPFVLQKSLDDYYVSYELNAYTQHSKKMPFIYSEMHKNILNIFNDAGVEILSPAYMAARDGSLTTVPSKLKPEDKSPLNKIVDHLTGRNQEVIVSNPKEEK